VFVFFYIIFRVRGGTYIDRGKKVKNGQTAPLHPLNRSVKPKYYHNPDDVSLRYYYLRRFRLWPSEFCGSPVKTKANDNSELAVYLTVHSPAEGVTGRSEVEAASTALLPQPHNSTALSGKKKQERDPCVNSLFCPSGEDRSWRYSCNILQSKDLW